MNFELYTGMTQAEFEALMPKDLDEAPSSTAKKSVAMTESSNGEVAKSDDLLGDLYEQSPMLAWAQKHAGKTESVTDESLFDAMRVKDTRKPVMFENKSAAEFIESKLESKSDIIEIGGAKFQSVMGNLIKLHEPPKAKETSSEGKEACPVKTLQKGEAPATQKILDFINGKTTTANGVKMIDASVKTVVKTTGSIDSAASKKTGIQADGRKVGTVEPIKVETKGKFEKNIKKLVGATKEETVGHITEFKNSDKQSVAVLDKNSEDVKYKV
jgi:hypothetical protein